MTDDTITSARSPHVSHVRELHRGRGRRDHGEFLVEGPGPVTELAASPLLERVYMTHDGRSRLAPEVVAALAGKTVTVGDAVLERMVTTPSPQGLVAVAKLPALDSADEATALAAARIVFLDGVADPGNVGTIIRSADAFGYTTVVLGPGSADPYGPKVVRACAGSLTHITVLRTDDLASMIQRARSSSPIVIAGLDAAGAAPTDSLSQEARVGIVVGAEAHGMSAAVRVALDTVCALPMRTTTESLNAAVAASIAMFATASV